MLVGQLVEPGVSLVGILSKIIILNINERLFMAKKKLTESDCQRLVKEVHNEERVKLEERFKADVKQRMNAVERSKKLVEHREKILDYAKKSHAVDVEELKKLESADLDQWGKDNPEKQTNQVIFCGGGRRGGKSWLRDLYCNSDMCENYQHPIDSFRMVTEAMNQYSKFFQIPIVD